MKPRIFLYSIALTLLSAGLAFAESAKTDIKGVRLGDSMTDAETATQGKCQRAGVGSASQTCAVGQGEYFTLDPAEHLYGLPLKRLSYNFCSPDTWEVMSKNVTDTYGVEPRKSSWGNLEGRLTDTADEVAISLYWTGGCGGTSTSYLMVLSDRTLSEKDASVVNGAAPTTKF